ncbi:MAG: hypothetical protein HUN05_08900 [Desulfobacter sp.]|nr:MAG: hypothetical protein HUN05_08900 [Desulfobacter sp.]
MGQYFLAAEHFLTNTDNPALENAVTTLTGSHGQVKGLNISLEKHGAFYHPLKITVKSNDNHGCTLVLNGAVDRPGLDLVEQECQLMADLGAAFTPCCLPKVFGAGRQKIRGMETAFFLGEWLEGFYEFHVTRTGKKEGIAVWGKNLQDLSYETAAPLYEQAAHILTLYYDVSTGASIFPWHHGAGDFVVNPTAAGLPVRLITARGFSPLAETKSCKDARLPSLLFFFLCTILRMRLDRLDGTGPAVFLKKQVAQASVNGFFKALAGKAEAGPGQSAMDKGFFQDLPEIFHEFILNFSSDQLEAITARMVNSWHAGPSEYDLIQKNIRGHTNEISRILKNR